MSSRKVPEINAGSMADIAFLLLVFFLVTTTIQTDAGLSVLLPPHTEEEIDVLQVPRRNVFSVQINKTDDLLFRDKPGQMATLKNQVKEFIANPQQREDYASSPKKAIVTLLNDNGCTYDTYLTVYNELKRAYKELWDERAMAMFGRAYDDLNKNNQKLIRDEIPLVISEAEPTNFGT